MTAALEGGEWSAACSGRTLPPGKTRYPFYRRLDGFQGRPGRAENLVPTGIRSRTVQPLVSRYTDWTTRPTKFSKTISKWSPERWSALTSATFFKLISGKDLVLGRTVLSSNRISTDSFCLPHKHYYTRNERNKLASFNLGQLIHVAFNEITLFTGSVPLPGCITLCLVLYDTLEYSWAHNVSRVKQCTPCCTY